MWEAIIDLIISGNQDLMQGVDLGASFGKSDKILCDSTFLCGEEFLESPAPFHSILKRAISLKWEDG